MEMPRAVYMTLVSNVARLPHLYFKMPAHCRRALTIRGDASNPQTRISSGSVKATREFKTQED